MNTAITVEHLSTADNRHICEITLNRPECKNAINQAMYRELTATLKDAADNSSIRAVLLSGADGCFTSGNDLADFANATDLDNPENPIIAFMTALAEFPKPVVVAVEGVAIGIGTTLLLHSDLVYASGDAVFKLPFVNLGLCPEYASSLILPRLAGYVKASEWLLLGEEFSAAEARDAGLVNAVIDDPLAVAREQCQKLAAQPPAALRTAKQLLKRPQRESVDSAIRAEIGEFAKALQGPEFKEAVTAFFEKRPADFSSFD